MSSSSGAAPPQHDASDALGGWVTSLALSDHGENVLCATAGRNGALFLLQRKDNGRLDLRARGALGCSLAWCDVLRDDLFITASEDKRVRAWRPRLNRALNRGRPRELLELRHVERVGGQVDGAERRPLRQDV